METYFSLGREKTCCTFLDVQSISQILIQSILQNKKKFNPGLTVFLFFQYFCITSANFTTLKLKSSVKRFYIGMAPLNSRLRLKLPNIIYFAALDLQWNKSRNFYWWYLWPGHFLTNRRPYESLKGVFIKSKPGCLGSFWINLSDCLKRKFEIN